MTTPDEAPASTVVARAAQVLADLAPEWEAAGGNWDPEWDYLPECTIMAQGLAAAGLLAPEFDSPMARFNRASAEVAESMANLRALVGNRPKHPRAQASTKCLNPLCGHADTRHNELGYCQSNTINAAAKKDRNWVPGAIIDGCHCDGVWLQSDLDRYLESGG